MNTETSVSRNASVFQPRRHALPVFAVFLLAAVCHAESDAPTEAARLMEEARSCDAGYCGSERADREKAIATYEATLKADPDKDQTLEILFRIAQLHSVNYHVAKGEKPRHGHAMQLYQRIVSEYPSDEPLAMASMIHIGSIHVIERRFLEALSWYNRALEVPLDDLLRQQDAMRDDPDRQDDFERITKRIEQLRFYQSCAVGAASSAAMLVDRSLRASLLEDILRRHSEDHIHKAVASIVERDNIELYRLPENIADLPSATTLPSLASGRVATATSADGDEDQAAASSESPSLHGSTMIIIACCVVVLVMISGGYMFYRRTRNQPSR